MFSYEEAMKDSISYFNGDELAAGIFVGKYALRDEDGNILESIPDQMHRRLAKEFARIEANYPNPLTEEEIYNLFKNFEFVIPQGSPMSAIGNDYQIQSVSNCFVIDSPKDSYSGILKTDQEQAQIMKRRGGVGFDISNIRPKGSKTKNAARTTDGIGVFMERFSNTCREVAQGGRRGALMLTISCHHPEIRTFINIKKDLKKVTGANISIRLTDEFMNAVKNKQKVELRWPVDSSNPSIKESVDAESLWNEIIEAAWASAEPGLLFWDTAQRLTPSDIYKDFGYESTSTNPCITGDTLISVADGRGFVEISKLAEEGLDIPVYCCDDRGRIAVRTMRNPRITGYNQDVYEVILDDGSKFKTTSNHRMMMRDGSFKEVKDIVPGDSLHVGFRYEGSIVDIPNVKSRNVRTMYWMLKNCNNAFKKTEHRYIYNHHFGDVGKGYIVHHKDHNSKNNKIENLEKMLITDHNEHHKEKMMGANNPIHKILADPERSAQYRKLQSELNTGLKNGNAKDISNTELKAKGIELTLSIGRRFSIKEWQEYAKNNDLPLAFADYRYNEFGDVLEFSKKCAQVCGISAELIEIDPRTTKLLQKMQSQGYKCSIKDSRVFVEKVCECCGDKFEVAHGHREVSCCGITCANKINNSNPESCAKRAHSINESYKIKMDSIKKSQMDLYCDFKYIIGREPMLKEYKLECKKNDLSCRFGTKYGFNDYGDLKINAAYNNHKVISVAHAGKQDVYNGTVDEFHNFYIGGNEQVVDGRKERCMFNSKNCGEIILSPSDSCRLMCINLMGFVNNKFTSSAQFDYDNYSKVIIQSQRLMDDMIDLEIEQIDKILHKIEIDPEDGAIKFYEKRLWENIRTACVNGRRTGLGITALGDTLAALGIKYGSQDSIEITEKIYQTLAINSYKSSCIMAGERGCFPVFDRNLEKDHPFISRIINSDPELLELYMKYGRRNIANTTTAPTGSVSTMTQTTSGIEPAYLIFYKRRKKINPNDVNSRVDFVDDMGDKWQEYPVFHHAFKSWMDINGYKLDESKNCKTADDLEFYKVSPYYQSTSNDIDWLASVEIQAVAQKWICHAISKTCNVPESCTKDTISEVYMKAWEHGCKGFTVYRDKCRAGVLISGGSNESKKDSFNKTTAPKRPKSLDCDIYETKVGGEEFFVVVGKYQNTPYEIFAGKGKITPSKQGKLVKIKRGHYDLHTDDGIVIENISSKFTDEEVVIARMTSLSLRHGSDIKFIVDQIEKAPGDMHSFGKSIGRILKKYIPNGEKVTGQSCDSCKSESLVREEGCVSCKSCGWSKCS
jgi:ribonucleotide reductase alpha subunit